MIKSLMPPKIKEAFDIIMVNQVDYESDYSWIVFDVEKWRMDATTGFVSLDITPAGQSLNGSVVELKDFIFVVDSDGNQERSTQNLWIHYKYAIMLWSFSYMKVHMQKDRNTGEDIPHMLEVEDEQGRNIWFKDFKYGGRNTLMLKKPALQKDLFGKDYVPQFHLAKYKEKFDRALKKLNPEATFNIGEEITFSVGTVEKEDYEFYLATKTPLYSGM